jgi:prolyl 4-hydroxylase
MSHREDDVMDVLHEDPQVLVKENFVSKEDCEHFMNICKDKLKEALVSNNKQGMVSAGRSGKNCWLAHDHDSITKRVADRISQIVDIPLSHAEIFQVIYYDITQEYRSHYDGWLHNNSEKSNRCMKYGGQRVATALCYLNDVEEGGCTGFPRLNIEVPPQQGKLLIFHNVYKDSGKETGRSERHPLSEHAGRPVVKGEKWAFNLWFRETPKNILYVPPTIPALKEVSQESSNDSIQKLTMDTEEKGKEETIVHQQVVTTYSGTKKEILNEEHNIFVKNNILDDNDIEVITKLAKLTPTEKRNSAWIKNTEIPAIILKLVNATNHNPSFYENTNVVQYAMSHTHNRFLDAYDFNTEAGNKNMKKGGQRLYTITCFLSDKMTIKFNKLDLVYQPKPGSLLTYRNTEINSNIRSMDMYHEITNENNEGALLFNVYVREKNTDGEELPNHFNSNENVKLQIKEIKPEVTTEKTISHPPPTSDVPPPVPKQPKIEATEKKEPDPQHEKNETDVPPPATPVDFMKELDEVYDKFKDGTMSIRGHKSMKFINKIPFNIVCDNANKLSLARNGQYGALNPKCFDQKYHIDEYTPLVIDNVYNDNAYKIIKEYFHSNIDSGNFALGDRQANRYKSNNESFSRLIQYELLPLIEHIVNKKMQPTYIYVSCYTKNQEKDDETRKTDLPPHTDRPDCEYTISYIIDKPDGSNWPIYVDKTKQPVKNKGRYWFYPPKENCIAVDGKANSLMMFNGTDHIHYREEMPCDFYYIVLLHFRSVEI